MSEGIYHSLGVDYEPFLETEEDFKKFKRMKELEGDLDKHISECFHQVVEYNNLRRELMNLPPQKIILQNYKMN